MTVNDWIVFGAFLVYVVVDGLRHSRANESSEDYFLAGRRAPWWVMGLSIMATQASAITMISTTGKGWRDGMMFLQFYLALPIAMVILAFTLVPLYHRLKVFTAYEYLGQRFDRKTRWLSALLFVLLRGLSVGVVIYAPSVILSLLFGWPVSICVAVMGGVAVLYTAIGGMGAVLRTDVKQMTVMTVGLVVALFTVLRGLPDDVGLGDSLRIAGAMGRLEALSFDWNPSNKYTVWSALLGGTFLFLAYFGSDQSQVQRYLSGRSLRDSQLALGMNAICKLPFQGLVLLTGVLLVVFYMFQPHPVSFLPMSDSLAGEQRMELESLDQSYEENRKFAAAAARQLLAGGTDDEFQRTTLNMTAQRDMARNVYARAEIDRDEVNFVFPHFILNFMPTGIAGLLLAAIFAAALSSIDSELNALSTVSVKDLLPLADASEKTQLRYGRWCTLLWGILATVFAVTLGKGALIEQVNEIGSYFYGSLLGVFVLSFIPWATGWGAFLGMIGGMATVARLNQVVEDLAFLWLNTAGTAAVVLIGLLVSMFTSARQKRGSS